MVWKCVSFVEVIIQTPSLIFVASGRSVYAVVCSSCALQPLAGKLYTLLTLKYTFLAFLGVFEVGSALCGAARCSTMLIVGRAVAGMGGSGLTNGAITILASAAPKQQQPRKCWSRVDRSDFGDGILTKLHSVNRDHDGS